MELYFLDRNFASVSPPVDTAAIGAAVASAISSYQPVVNIGGRQFYGAMQETNQQFANRF